MQKLIFIWLLSIQASLAIAQTTPKTTGLLTEMTDSVLSNKYTGIHSILIAKDNKVIYEQYFNGYQKDTLHDSRSSFKSITSLLTGIAIDKGMISDVNKKVLDFFPEYPELKNDVRKKEMTIQHLLNMESGLDCEEFNSTKDCEAAMEPTSDWVKFSLHIPMKDEPGKVWAYTSCNPVILGGIISKAAKMSIMDFAKKNLFDPLEIKDYRWTTDVSGNGNTGGSFFIRPADMLKIGLMVRDQGKWKGKQVISKKWIQESTQANILIPDFSFMKSSRSQAAIPQPTSYGDYWYRELIKTATFEEPLLFASGNGGQFIFILKDKNIVVVFTQGNYNSWKAKRAFELMAKYIIPYFNAK